MTGTNGFRLASGFSLARTLSSSARFACIERSAVKVRRASGRAGRSVYVDKRHSKACPLAWSTRGRTLFHAHDEIMRIDTVMQFAVNDSEHDPIISGVLDPKAAGPIGSYAPQLSITSAELASTPITIMVPFAGAGAPMGGSPAIQIDPSKLVGVQWQMSTPVASNGGATECVWNIDVPDVRFY